MFSTFFIYYVGVLRTILFLLSLSITLVCCALFVFYFLHLLRWCVAHYLFSTFSYNYVGMLRTFCFLVSSSYVGVLRTICFLVSLTITLVLRLFVFYFDYYVGVLRTISFLLSVLRWCFAHYLFYSLTITLVYCTLFVFYFN